MKSTLILLLGIFASAGGFAQSWVITRAENRSTHQQEYSELVGAYFFLSPGKARIAYSGMSGHEYECKIADMVIYLDGDPRFVIETRTRTTMELSDYNDYSPSKRREEARSRYFLHDLGSYLRNMYDSGRVKTEFGETLFLNSFFHPVIAHERIDSAIIQNMPPIIKGGSASGYILFRKDTSASVTILQTTGKFNENDAANLQRVMLSVSDRFNIGFLPGKIFKLLFHVRMDNLPLYSLRIYWYTTSVVEREMSYYEFRKEKDRLGEIFNKKEFGQVVKGTTALLKIDSSDQSLYFLRSLALLETGQVSRGCSELARIAKDNQDAKKIYSTNCKGSLLKKISVLGRVVDQESRKPVKQARIYDELSIKDIETNALGYFQMVIDSGAMVIVSHPDYDSVSLAISATKFQVPLTKIPVATGEMKGKIFYDVDRPAYVNGGEAALGSFFEQNMRHPSVLRTHGHRGQVDLNLLIAENGVIDSVVLLKSTHELHTLEAFRLMHLLHRIEPAIKNGTRVRSWASLTIHFPTFGGGLVRERNVQEKALAADYYRTAVSYVPINYTEALAILHRCLTLDPTFAAALYTRGSIYYELGDQVAAREDWKRAMLLDYKATRFVKNVVAGAAQK